MPATPLRLRLALLTAAAALTACTASTPTVAGGPSAPASAVTTVASPACPALAPADLKVGEGALTAETRFGFVHHADGEAFYVDAAEFFGNDAATKAAREDGKLPAGGLPNPFYVRNADTSLVRVPVAADVAVSLLEATSLKRRPMTADAFARLYCAGSDTAGWYGLVTQLPMALVIADGRITAANEVYLP